jgi:hypothetical protein
MQPTTTYNLFHIINQIAEAINQTLNEKQKERYLAGILMLYSFIEKLLVLLTYTKILWENSEKTLHRRHQLVLKEFCNHQEFYSVVRLALAVRLIDIALFRRLEAVRVERNSIIHQFWLYQHRENRLVLRKKLEKLAHLANDLISVFNALVEETGADESYDIFTIRAGKGMLV